MFQGESMFSLLNSELDQFTTLTVDTQEQLIAYCSNLKSDIINTVNKNTASTAFCEAAELWIIKLWDISM